MNSNANNKRRRLLAGIFVASSCKFATCSPDRNSYLTALAVDRSSSSFEKKTASHGAKHGQSMEVVASAIRRTSNVADANFIDGANAQREASHQRRSRRQQQQSNRQSKDNDTQRELIVGGTAAPPGRFPYAVSLQLEKVLDETSSSTENESGNAEEVSDVHTCGGTLIAMDVVLTAGHCGYEEHVLETTNTDEQVGSVNSDGHVNFGQIPEQIFYGADVGAYDLTTEDTSGYTNMLFEKLVLHPDYTGFHGKGNSRMSLQHDVMLVKLYGASEKPVVKLHNPKLKDEDYIQRDPVQGEELVVMGWGDTDPAIGGEESISLASVLNVATVGYVPNDVCEESKGYSNVQSSGEAIDEMEDYFEYDGTISSDMMCALGDASQDACQGDSGGGLFRLGENFNGDEDVQMGIVSWGLQCGDEDFPGVYARVGEHFDWIEKQVCELSDSPPSYFDCPTKAYPPGSPYDPVVDLTITIRFDDYRSETGWVLESLPDLRNMAFRPFGTYKSETTVDDNNAMTETVPVHSGRFYMLSVLDEFADGFCCTVGEGYFRVDSAAESDPVVETTPGILWSPHALRRAFYVSPPDTESPPNYVTISVTLGVGADPRKFLLVALENTQYEALLLYEIRPFVIMTESRAGTGTTVYSRTFKVPVLGVEFERQRYNVMMYDDNEGESAKAGFEVYLGDAEPNNLILSQSGNYGNKNNIARSFVLFKKSKEEPSDSPAYIMPTDEIKEVMSVASSNAETSVVCSILSLLYLTLSVYRM